MKYLSFNGDHTMTYAREALEARIVKLALDGRMDEKRENENALIDINAALVASLPDRPSIPGDVMVQCFIRRSELKDLETALNEYIKEFDGVVGAKTIERFEELLRRTKISLALNP